MKSFTLLLHEFEFEEGRDFARKIKDVSGDIPGVFGQCPDDEVTTRKIAEIIVPMGTAPCDPETDDLSPVAAEVWSTPIVEEPAPKKHTFPPEAAQAEWAGPDMTEDDDLPLFDDDEESDEDDTEDEDDEVEYPLSNEGVYPDEDDN